MTINPNSVTVDPEIIESAVAATPTGPWTLNNLLAPAEHRDEFASVGVNRDFAAAVEEYDGALSAAYRDQGTTAVTERILSCLMAVLPTLRDTATTALSGADTDYCEVVFYTHPQTPAPVAMIIIGPDGATDYSF